MMQGQNPKVFRVFLLFCGCFLLLPSIGFGQALFGYQNAAAGGAGLALTNNVASIFGNPAAVEQPRRASGEVGATGIGDVIVPWAAWLQPAGREASVGVGLVESDFGAIDAHQVNLTGVSRVFRGSWIGGRASIQKIPEETNLDFSLGGFHRVGGQFALGWSAAQISKSLNPADCEGCDQRLYGFGASWSFDREGRYAIFSDIRTQDELLRRDRLYATNFGARIEIGANRNLQLLTAVQRATLDASTTATLSAGVAVQQYFFSTLVSARYSMSGLPIQHGKGLEPMHQVSLGFIWDAFVDRTDPKPFVRSTLAQISPRGTENLPRNVDFLLRVTEESGKLADWSLVLYSTTADLKPDQLARRFQGRGVPPASVHWDGDDYSGNPSRPGVYAYRLIVADAAGNQSWTEWQHIEIR